jgi:GNAT superfamily N-acetyltransferase
MFTPTTSPPWRLRRRARTPGEAPLDDLPLELRRGPYRLTSDRSRFDLEMVHRYLTQESYWGRDISRDGLDRAVRNSLCIGLYRGRQQVGFGRAVTDHATFGYLADVFVREGHRGSGLGTWLVQALLSHPSLSGRERWLLRTKDAHGFYVRLGFRPLPLDGRLMIRDERCV